MKEEYLDLIKKAISQKQFSYSPYSHFRVGSALLTKSGKFFLGANVENAGYSPSICSERVAISSAIANGERELEAIAICGDSGDYCYPCGVCRQIMVEFNPELLVILVKNENEYKTVIAKDLLPNYFGPEIKK